MMTDTIKDILNLYKLGYNNCETDRYGKYKRAYDELLALEDENVRLRVAVGAALLPGGLQKALGLIGGSISISSKEEPE